MSNIKQAFEQVIYNLQVKGYPIKLDRTISHMGDSPEVVLKLTGRDTGTFVQVTHTALETEDYEDMMDEIYSLLLEELIRSLDMEEA